MQKFASSYSRQMTRHIVITKLHHYEMNSLLIRKLYTYILQQCKTLNLNCRKTGSTTLFRTVREIRIGWQ